MYDKMLYLKWVLPNSPFNRDMMSSAWYTPTTMSSAQKPRVPGHEEDVEALEDEENIFKSVDYVDKLIDGETQKGTDPRRIIVGGFSQGCAVSLVWGLIGRWRDKVAGVVLLSGYFPLADRMEEIRRDKNIETVKDKGDKKWFLAHGTKDVLIPTRLFNEAKESLGKFIDVQRDVESHIYEGMGHSVGPPVLRDLLGWFAKVIPA